MSILKVIGKIGAIAAGGAALILAGKTGFGSDLFSKGEDDTLPTDDLTNPEVPEQTPEVVEEEVQEEETSE